MLDLWLEIVNSVLKHGFSWAAAGALVVALLKNRKEILKLIHKGQEQETQMDRMERKLDAILSKEGVTWDVHCLNGKPALNATDGLKSSLLQRLAAFVRAPIIGASTRQIKDSYHSKTREGNTQMKSKLLSRKFLMAIISAALVIANDGLNLGLDQNTIVAFGSIVVAWIVGESAVDLSSKPKINEIEKSYHGE